MAQENKPGYTRNQRLLLLILILALGVTIWKVTSVFSARQQGDPTLLTGFELRIYCKRQIQNRDSKFYAYDDSLKLWLIDFCVESKGLYPHIPLTAPSSTP